MKRLITLVLIALLFLNSAFLTSCHTKTPQETEATKLLIEAAELCENKIDAVNELVSISSSKEACTAKHIYAELAKVFDCDKKVFGKLKKDKSALYDPSSLATALKNYPEEVVLAIVNDCYGELGLNEKIDSKIADAKEAIFEIDKAIDNYDLLTGYYKKITACNNFLNENNYNTFKRLDKLIEKLDEYKMSFSSYKMKLS